MGATSKIDTAFTKPLPKIELHAHLTGSITPQTLHEIWTKPKLVSPSLALDDPLNVLSKDKVWNITNFFTVFSKYIYELCSTADSIVYSTNAVLQDFYEDGVVYLELRTTPRSSPSVSKEEYISMVLHCIETFPHCNRMPTYLILSIDRRNSATQAMEVVNLALKYRSHGVVGIDLCGDPNQNSDITTFKPAFTKAKQHGLKITLHFAEIPVSSSESELETLLSFEPDRLGHVIHVPDPIKREIVRRKIGVELCVSCNVQAAMTEGGVTGHHFREWWQETESPIALCVSKESAPRYNSLSH